MLLLYVVFCHLVLFVLNYLSSGGRESLCLTLQLVLVVLTYLLSRDGGGGGGSRARASHSATLLPGLYRPYFFIMGGWGGGGQSKSKSLCQTL